MFTGLTVGMMQQARQGRHLFIAVMDGVERPEATAMEGAVHPIADEIEQHDQFDGLEPVRLRADGTEAGAERIAIECPAKCQCQDDDGDGDAGAEERDQAKQEGRLGVVLSAAALVWASGQPLEAVPAPTEPVPAAAPVHAQATPPVAPDDQTITVTARDANNNLIAGATVVLAATGHLDDTTDTMPQVLFTGMHHSREPISMMNLVYTIDLLALDFANIRSRD